RTDSRTVLTGPIRRGFASAQGSIKCVRARNPMEETPIPVYDDGRDIFQLFLGQCDAPAFARRGRDVEGSWRTLLEECRRLRDPLLDLVRLRLGTLHALLDGNWSAMRPLVREDVDLQTIAQLHEEHQPQLRIPVASTSAAKVIR